MDTGDFPNAGNPNRGDRRGATSRRPTAGNPNRRDRRGTRAAASGRPGVDDGWDPNPATGLPPRELGLELRGEWCSLSEQTRHEQQLLNEAIISGGDVHYHRERLHELLLRSSEMLMQASSSAAPPSDHPEAERTGSGIRQSVLYSNRPRRSRPRRPSQHLEHPSEVSSREVELEVANVSTFEAPSVRETSIASPSDHPEAEGSVTGTHIWQSALYSSRPRRPRRRHAPLPTEDHPSEVSTSELGGAVTDLPTLDEALSLSDPPPLTPQISDEETTDDDDACSHLYRPRDDGRSISPRVLTKSMLESLGDRFFPTVPYEAMRRPDLHVDSEEFIREMKEYSDKHPPVSLEEAFDSIWAVEHAALTALAAKKGIEPPRDPFLVDQEAPLLQAQQEDSASAPHSQDSIAISHEASTEVVQDGKQMDEG